MTHAELNFPDSLIQGVQFFALACAVIGLWLPWRRVSAAITFSATGIALGSGAMTLTAASILGLLTILIGLYRYYLQRPFASAALLVGISVVSIGLGVHAFPGFTNWLVAGDVKLGATGVPFSIWYYLDKPFVGVLLLLFLAESMRGRSLPVPLSQTLLTAMVGIAMVYAFSYAVGYVRIDPKASMLFFPWAIKNLLFVCVTEEVFFRGLLQNHLSRWIPHRQRHALSLVIVAILFGIAHVGGGITYVLLATIAGLVYGLVYLQSGRIEFAILTHFALNCGHYVFLSYPYAQS